MKHLKLFFALFAMLALGVTNAWGAEETVVYTETFEDSAYKTSTTYNNSSEKKHGPTNRQWGVLCGTPNTGAHNGSKAFAMRYYKSVSKTPTLTQYFDINNVDAISFWSKTESTNNKLNVEYSTDGGSSWSSLASNISITTSYKEYSYNFSTQQAKVRLRFTMGTTTEKKSMIIDDIEFISTSSTGSGTEEPVLSVEPNKVDFGTKNIYFESEKQGSLEIEITGKNLTGNVTAALSGIDANIFDLSQESFTPEDGEVSEKLTVSYEVSEEKEYSATLTLSSNGVDNVELPITLTTINKKPTVYTKVTDAATLSAGDKVIFVYEAGKVAAGKLSSGYLTSIDIAQAINTTANPATVSITDEAVIEYTLGGTTGAWEFISASGKLSEASANSTKSVDLAYNKGTTWTIAISSGNATIKGTTNTIQYNEANPRFKTYTSGQKTIQLYAISVPKYAVNFAQPEGGELIVKNGENAIVSGNTFAEGIKLTVIANPANGYEGGTVVVKDAVGNDVTATVYADGVLTMPAYAVTISATFEKKECTLLATPTVSATTTYNSATLSWGAVTKAAKYSVKIGDKDAVETTATSYEVTDLNAETTYTYQVQAIAEAGQDTDCDSEVAEGTFTTATAPVATVTLSDVDGEKTLKGSLCGTITLPKTAAECSKTFVGWDADENCNHAPTYAPGAEYTFTTQDPTLYAVYADENNAAKEEVYTFTSFTQANTVTIDAPESFTITLLKGSASTAPQWNSGSSQARVYAQGSLVISADAPISKIVYTYIVNKNNNNVVPTIDGVTGKTNAGTWDASTKTWTGNDTKVTFSTSGTAGNVGFTKVAVTVGAITYSNYSTTCAAAPIATVDPTSVTATVAGGNGKVEVTYENVNTENVSVALYNDAACTETFTASWLTASIDADKNIAYTVAENTTYAERKAYIQLTAPETTGATDPAVVVIPVTQAAKDKVFASLEELVAADLTAGDEVTVTLNNDVIKEFYIYSPKRCGVVFDVQKDGKDIKIFFNNQTTIVDWAVGGKLSGTLTNVKWTTYSSAWQLAPANTWAWANLTYTEPKAVSTVVVSGAPTKTTYVDGEAFDPAGLTVTVNYNDATNEVNPTGVTFAVTPATLVKGQTSVSVTATFNSVSSAAYEVTGLTVNDIPTKTVAEFIAAGGTRCYLEGIVSGLTEGNSMKYGNFDLTDASGTIYVYGCLNAAGESKKFAELGVKNGDKIKVIADEYELYDSTKDEAKNVQYVSHVSAASITIADITMEVDEVKTISATVEPAEAVVTYTIKENAENAISLEGNTITALAEGTATITATVAEGADYLANSVDFIVTVNPQNIAVLPFEFDKGKNDIANTLGMSQEGLGSDYSSSPKIKFDDKDDYVIVHFDSEPGALSYTIKANVNSGDFTGGFDVQVSENGDDYDVLVSYTELEKTAAQKTHKLDKNVRYVKFVYTNKVSGQNVALGNILISKLSVLRADLYDGKWGTLCPDQKVTYMQGASFYTLTYLEMKDGMPYKLFFDEITTDYLEAGKPYLFIAEGEEIKGVKSGEVVSIASNYNGFYGNVRGSEISLTTTQTEYVAGGDVVNNYGVINSRFTLLGDGTTVAHERAYVQIKNGQLDCPNPPASLPALAPGARRVVAGATGINTATGVDQVQGDNVSTKMIINGQLFILRGEKMYNAQGKLVK